MPQCPTPPHAEPSLRRLCGRLRRPFRGLVLAQPARWSRTDPGHGRVALKHVRGAVGFVPAARPNLRRQEY